MKNKGKVWVDIDKVVKASSVPRTKKKWYEMMKEVPRGEKSSNWASFLFLNLEDYYEI